MEEKMIRIRITSVHIKKLVYSALCLAIALVLPIITGNIQTIGNMLCPMHIPVLLCGFICGPWWGLVVGALAPLVRFLIFSMPPIYPTAIAMAFELAAYGFFAGMLYKRFPKKIGFVYLDLILAMIIGRVVWGIAQTILLSVGGKAFTFAAFVSGAITLAIPGIIIQLAIIPAIVTALRAAKITLND